MLTNDRRRAPASTGEERRRPNFATVFTWLHLGALRQRPLVTVLAVCGVGLGTAVLVGIVALYLALGRPFTSLTDAARGRVDAEVVPHVRDRLPENALRQLRQVPGVRAAIPIVGGLTTLGSEQGSHGGLLVGSDCSIEHIVGDIDCRGRLARADMADGPGVPLVLSRPLASALHVSEGDPVGISGGTIGSAHVGTVISSPRGASLNGGHWAVGAVPDVQALVSAGPYLHAVYLDTDGSSRTTALIREATAGTAALRPVGSDMRMLITLARSMLLFAAVMVVICGAMIATNSFTLSLDDRRKTLAVSMVLGSSPARMVLSLTLEGAILGLVGGLLAIPGGYALGRLFTSYFGTSLLQGSGAGLHVEFDTFLVLLALVVGAVAGAAAALSPALRLARDGGVVAIREQAGILPSHEAPRWLVAGFLLVPVGGLLLYAYGQGYVPLPVGLCGMGIALFGLLLGVLGASPYGIRTLAALTKRSSASGILAIADLARDPMRLAAVVATVSIGVGAAIGLSSSQRLVSDAIAHSLDHEMRNDIYVYPKHFRSHVDASLSASTLAALEQLPHIDSVLPQKLVLSDWGTQGTNLVGTDPTNPRRNLVIRGDADEAWQRVAGGEVIVSSLVANTMRVERGAAITLPTPSGPRSFVVAAIADALYGQDNGVAGIVVASNETLTKYWDAPTEFAVVRLAPNASRSSALSDIDALDEPVELFAYDSPRTRRVVEQYFATFFAPLNAIGYTLLLVAGLAVSNYLVLSLLQRRRLRAVLRFCGFTPPIERRTLVIQALVMGSFGAFFGLVSALTFSFLMTLAAPALLASAIPWAAVPSALGIGAIAALGICLVATILPSIEAGNLDVLEALVAE